GELEVVDRLALELQRAELRREALEDGLEALVEARGVADLEARDAVGDDAVRGERRVPPDARAERGEEVVLDREPDVLLELGDRVEGLLHLELVGALEDLEDRVVELRHLDGDRRELEGVLGRDLEARGGAFEGEELGQAFLLAAGPDEEALAHAL